MQRKKTNAAVRLCKGRRSTGQIVSSHGTSVLRWWRWKPKVGNTSMSVTIRESETSSPAAAGQRSSMSSKTVPWYDDGKSSAVAG